MAMPWQLRNSKRRRPRIPSHGQPSELMRSIELRRVIYWSAVAAIAVLFAYSPAMALMPAAIATKRSTRRKKNQIGRKGVASTTSNPIVILL